MKKLLPLFILCLLLDYNGFSQSFNWLWASDNSPSIGQTYVQTSAIVSDKYGNVYLTGTYVDPFIAFGPDTLHSSVQTTGNAFITKYSPSGNVLWAKNAITPVDTPTDLFASSITTDTNANVIVACQYTGGPVTFGSFTLPYDPGGDYNIFLLKMDSLGNVLWVSLPQGTTGAYSTGLATDINCNIFFTGAYNSDSIVFGATTLYLTSGFDPMEMFIAKYDAAGNVLWAKGSATIGGKGVAGSTAIALDPQANAYVTGTYQADTVIFGNVDLKGEGEVVYGFLVKYDSSGNLIWAESPGPFVCGNGVATFGDEAVYVTGLYQVYASNIDTFFLTKYNTAGNVIWTKNTDSCTSTKGYSVITDINGNVYVSGGMTCNEISFDGTQLQASGGGPDPMFIFILDSSAHVICADALGNGGHYNNSLALGNNGVLYAGGSFYDTAFGLGSLSLACSTNNQNAFVAASICGACNNSPGSLTAAKNNICPTDSAEICAPSGYNSYLWNTGQTSTCIYTQTSGDYYCTVTNGVCSSSSNHISINVYASPQVSITISGDTLRGYGSSSYQWLLNGNLIPGADSSEYIAPVPGSYTLQIVDSNGCAITSNPQIISGIDGIIDNSISIYPNPSHDNWVLIVDNNLIGAEVNVFDAEGRLVYKFEILNPKSEIAFNAASGVYELCITSANYKAVRKLVKSNR